MKNLVIVFLLLAGIAQAQATKVLLPQSCGGSKLCLSLGEPSMFRWSNAEMAREILRIEFEGGRLGNKISKVYVGEMETISSPNLKTLEQEPSAQLIKAERIDGNVNLTIEATCGGEMPYVFNQYLGQDSTLFDSDRDALLKAKFAIAIARCKDTMPKVPSVTALKVEAKDKATESEIATQKASVEEQIANLEANIKASEKTATKAELDAAKALLEKLRRLKP